MKISIPNNFFYQFIFFLCIAIPYLDHFELTIITWTIGLLLTISKSYSISILKITIPFFIVFFIALFIMFFYDYEKYYIIRDVTYLLKPIIGFFIGYQICKKNLHNAFNLLITTAFIIAIVHIAVIVFAFVVYRISTVNEIRYYGGYFSDYEVYILAILIFHKKFQLDYTKKKIQIYTAIIGFSVFLYLARTNFLQLLILVVAMKGYFRITKRSIKVITSIILLSIIGYSTVLYINPKRNGDGIEAFLYKIKVAPSETFKSKIKRDDYKDFNDHYRAYENIMTIRQVSKGGVLDILFGKGLGSRIDLRQKVYLGDMELRYISILHNGFMIVFLKSGLLGLFIFFYTIYYFFKKIKTKNELIKNINLLFVGTGVFLILSNWVFLGFYNLIDTKTILIGFLICYREKVIE
ncbi:MAG: hypothetical protein ACI9FW_000078 [Flavobacterium sp.]|jgi:hypothetical protein